MSDLNGVDLIYDWNVKGDVPKYPKRVMVVDETLRDGLQSPSVTHPSIQDKVYLLYLMRCLEIDAAALGLCGGGVVPLQPRAAGDVRPRGHYARATRSAQADLHLRDPLWGAPHLRGRHRRAAASRRRGHSHPFPARGVGRGAPPG